MTRTRTVPAPPERVWSVIANPERLVEWWPRVRRVEEADSATWTTVVASDRGGRVLRADYTRVGFEHPRHLSWRHEVAASPFERVMTSSVTDIDLEAVDGGTTAVTIRERIVLRGLSRLGGIQVRRAVRSKLDGALEGLERVVSDAAVR
ncbi:MAG: SRPBCC family protein [Thermoleophilaceae bacterium]